MHSIHLGQEVDFEDLADVHTTGSFIKVNHMNASIMNIDKSAMLVGEEISGGKLGKIFKGKYLSTEVAVTVIHFNRIS